MNCFDKLRVFGFGVLRDLGTSRIPERRVQTDTGFIQESRIQAQCCACRGHGKGRMERGLHGRGRGG